MASSNNGPETSNAIFDTGKVGASNGGSNNQHDSTADLLDPTTEFFQTASDNSGKAFGIFKLFLSLNY